VAEERLKLAVFVDFDNIQIGVKDTLGKEFDVALVLESLKERGEVVTKIAYGDWPRAGDQSRQMTQHAVHMVQRNVTPRGDKNGADINLALDALELAFTRHHINAFAIVGGDSDFIALVEKLKQYDKRVFVIGGRAFTSNILQRNCTEFIAYENLLRAAADGGGAAAAARPARTPRRGEATGRGTTAESRSFGEALPNIERALKIMADRGVAPQLGLLKSTVLQLDSTFSERDYGTTSFLEFIQKMEREGLVRLRRTDRGFLVDSIDTEAKSAASAEPSDEAAAPSGPGEHAAEEETPAAVSPAEEQPAAGAEAPEKAVEMLKQAMAAAADKNPNRPLYPRQVRQALRAVDKNFDERRYGFRGVLDLLHQAQREGHVRLQRDHKGVWRVFPVTPAAQPVPDAAFSAEPAAIAEASASFFAGEEEASAPTDGRIPPEPEVVAEELAIEDQAPATQEPPITEPAISVEPHAGGETVPEDVTFSEEAPGAETTAPAESLRLEGQPVREPKRLEAQAEPETAAADQVPASAPAAPRRSRTSSKRSSSRSGADRKRPSRRKPAKQSPSAE
jgi:uncharacterized protein (TIGR00288 family)